MQELSLDEITRWSPWPARLLGLTPWHPPSRTPAKVKSEYNDDKYARCLDFFRYAPASGPEEVKAHEFGRAADDLMLVSEGGRLCLLPLADARRHHYDLLGRTLAPALAQAATVVELGCGYGYNLWMLQRNFPGPRYLGGEFSANAVELARLLFSQGTGPSVRLFDFYQSDFAWVADLHGPLVVFTVHAIEQIPQFAPVLSRLVGVLRRRPVRVFHFEPIFGLHGGSLLGMLRQRYCEVNDYNRDLWESVQETPGLRIQQHQPDVYGLNALNPTSVIEWILED